MVDCAGRPLTFSELKKEIERVYGVNLHLGTLHRWRTRGVRGKYLHAWRCGGRWMSSLVDVRLMMEPMVPVSPHDFPPHLDMSRVDREFERQRLWRVLHVQSELVKKYQFPPIEVNQDDRYEQE